MVDPLDMPPPGYGDVPKFKITTALWPLALMAIGIGMASAVALTILIEITTQTVVPLWESLLIGLVYGSIFYARLLWNMRHSLRKQ
jgi:hypothetical protein